MSFIFILVTSSELLQKKADSNAENVFFLLFLLLEYLSGDKEPVEKFRLTNYFVLHIYISCSALIFMWI